MARPPPKLSGSGASKSRAVAQAFTGRRLQRLGSAVQAKPSPYLPFQLQGPTGFIALLQLGAACGLKGQLRAFPLQHAVMVDAQTGELVSAVGPMLLAASQCPWVKTLSSQWLACKSLSFSPGLEALLNSGSSGKLRVSLDICQHRSQAEELQHSELGLERHEFDVLSKPFWCVFNWVDWQAFCPKGSSLGQVQEVFLNKTQAVIRLRPVLGKVATHSSARGEGNVLVPVVPRYVLQVLPKERRLVLDWAF
ncbi:MAG: hypothetical protein VW440_03050 [Bordetella sp.]